MKRRSPQLFFVILLAAVLILPASLPPRPAAAARAQADRWTSVRSQNFLVEGPAREKELRRVAVRLEEYRAAFSRLLSGEHFDASIPTTVVVFPDDSAYRPFKPLFRGQTASGVAGYFQPGAEVNYITLALDAGSARDPSTLLHEYTHLLVNNYFRGAPLWLTEGLAEFYSTARVSADKRRVTLGEPPAIRTRALAGATLLPLSTLFAVGHASPHYSEAGRRGLFYAESWALVHYLIEVRGEHRDGLARFTALLAGGASVEDALRQAFGANVAEIEAGLGSYVRLARYPSSVEEFARPLDFDSQLSARPLNEADGLARLGDLLLHTERDAEAEGYLLRALELDPRVASARVSLGALRLRQNRVAEALEQLRAGVAADPANHLAHFYLADALNREGIAADAAQISVKDFEERTDAIRAELRRAIELEAGFVEAYRLLASVESERGDRPSEAAALLRRATALAPRRLDLVLLLAQAQMLDGQLAEARRLAAPIAQRTGDERLRAQAEALVARIESREEQAARERSRQADEAARLDAVAPAQPCDMPLQGGPHYKRLRFEGAQACGRLAAIECDAGGGAVVLRVETGAGTLRLRAEDLSGVRFVTYTVAVKTGRIACGPREHADPVLVTYRARPGDKPGFDGDALAVEFIPEDWNR
jgi:tetratricopeptide (TPR) repeat protein